MSNNDDATTSTPPSPVLRPVGSRFVPRPADSESGQTHIVQRVLHSSQGRPKPLTQRERVVAGDLPDWEPMPPGEIVVKRGS